MNILSQPVSLQSVAWNAPSQPKKVVPRVVLARRDGAHLLGTPQGRRSPQDHTRSNMYESQEMPRAHGLCERVKGADSEVRAPPDLAKGLAGGLEEVTAVPSEVEETVPYPRRGSMRASIALVSSAQDLQPPPQGSLPAPSLSSSQAGSISVQRIGDDFNEHEGTTDMSQESSSQQEGFTSPLRQSLGGLSFDEYLTAPGETEDTMELETLSRGRSLWDKAVSKVLQKPHAETRDSLSGWERRRELREQRVAKREMRRQSAILEKGRANIDQLRARSSIEAAPVFSSSYVKSDELNEGGASSGEAEVAREVEQDMGLAEDSLTADIIEEESGLVGESISLQASNGSIAFAGGSKSNEGAAMRLMSLLHAGKIVPGSERSSIAQLKRESIVL